MEVARIWMTIFFQIHHSYNLCGSAVNELYTIHKEASLLLSMENTYNDENVDYLWKRSELALIVLLLYYICKEK